MAYFFDELDFLIGGRLTSLSYTRDRLWSDEFDPDVVLLGQYIQLPVGQHVDVEEDFLGSHLPYRRAAFGGLDAEDDPWLFMLQAVPRSVVLDVFGIDADPFDVMRDAMRNALTYNCDAQTGSEGEWTRNDLIEVYRRYDIDETQVIGWTTFELVRGLLAELTGVNLTDIVEGYPGCAFPLVQHTCQHDVFDDAFVAWALRLSER